MPLALRWRSICFFFGGISKRGQNFTTAFDASKLTGCIDYNVTSKSVELVSSGGVKLRPIVVVGKDRLWASSAFRWAAGGGKRSLLPLLGARICASWLRHCHREFGQDQARSGTLEEEVPTAAMVVEVEKRTLSLGAERS